MTPAEVNIVKSLIALAWADGKMEEAESSVVEGLLVGLDATEAEEAALLEWAKTPRTLKRDVPKSDLPQADKELLLANAVLLAEADGHRSEEELAVLQQLSSLLGFSSEEAQAIMTASVPLARESQES